MHLPRLNPNQDKPHTLHYPTTAHLLLRPINAVLLAAGLAAGVLLAILSLPPGATALAQEPEPWCGDGVCDEDYGEAYYNCRDCLSSCNYCTDRAYCESIMPEDEWFFVPGFSGCSTEGCCIHIPPPDGTPPVTTAVLNGTPGLDNWFVSPVEVTLVATDDQSGVYSTNLDGTPYSGPRLYSAEGATTIAYQSYDNAGNLEPLKTTTFYIDTIPPLSLVAAPAEAGKWYYGRLVLAGVSFDETSGVAGVEVSLDSGATWLPATGGEVWAYEWDTRTASNAMHTIQVRGSDQAGNVETPLSLAVGVDNSGPFFDVGPFPSRHCFACSGAITFTLTAFDEQSKIANTAVVVKKDGKDVRVLKAPNGQLKNTPVVWDGRDEQGQPVPLGDYQLLFYTANQAGLFGSYGASMRVVDALPAAPPAAAPLAPVAPPEHTPWVVTPIPPASNPFIPPSGITSGPASILPGQAAASQASADSILSALAGATAGAAGGKTGAAGTGAAMLLVLAAAYIAARQAMGDGTLGKKLSELAGQYRPKSKPAAPPAPRVAPPKAPPPPPPAPPRPKPLRWSDIPQEPPPPPPPPVYYYAPPPAPAAPMPIPTYAQPWLPKPSRPAPIPTYARPWLPPPPPPPPISMYARPWLPQPPKPRLKPPPIPTYARPWAPPPPPIPTYAIPYLPPSTKPVVDMRALEREVERRRLHKSLEENSSLSWFQKTAAGLLGDAALALDAFDQYVAPKVKETVKAVADTGKKANDYLKERERKREKLAAELNKTDLSVWKKVTVLTLTDLNTSLGDFDKGIGQVVRPGLTKAANHAGQDIKKVLGWAPPAPGETRGQAATRLVTVDALDMLTLGLFRTETGKQIAVSTLTGMKEAVDHTSHNSRMVVGLEELDPGVSRWEAAGEALYGASTIMSLGGTADIREGIEEGDPVKVVMGTLQTASMFMMIGAAGSSIRAAGGKALGMVDDIAYKNLLSTAKTATTMGEAADGLSGGVQALQGVVTGNPVDILAGVANIAMVDLPPGTTKKVIGELAEEGVEKIAREAIEEVAGEGVEKVAKEAIEDVAGEAVEKAIREAAEKNAREAAEKAAREAAEKTTRETVEGTTEAAGKQTDDVIETVGSAQTGNALDSLNIKVSPDANVSIVELGARLEAAKATIETVCDIERLPKVDVELEELPTKIIDGVPIKDEGRYFPGNSDRPALIQIDPQGPTPELSLAHEMGHDFDNAFGVLDPKSGNRLMGSQAALKKLLAPEIQNAYDKLFKAIRSSRTYSGLQDALTLATENNYTDIAVHTKYLMQREELFARNYAQYVATRSGNEILMNQVAIKSKLVLNNIRYAWPSDDFEVIGRAFDQLFKVTGMGK